MATTTTSFTARTAALAEAARLCEENARAAHAARVSALVSELGTAQQRAVALGDEITRLAAEGPPPITHDQVYALVDEFLRGAVAAETQCTVGSILARKMVENHRRPYREPHQCEYVAAGTDDVVTEDDTPAVAAPVAASSSSASPSPPKKQRVSTAAAAAAAPSRVTVVHAEDEDGQTDVEESVTTTTRTPQTYRAVLDDAMDGALRRLVHGCLNGDAWILGGGVVFSRSGEPTEVPQADMVRGWHAWVTAHALVPRIHVHFPRMHGPEEPTPHRLTRTFTALWGRGVVKYDDHMRKKTYRVPPLEILRAAYAARLGDGIVWEG